MRVVDLPQGSPLWPAALPVLQQLRPHLDSGLLEDVLTQGASQGLRFVAVASPTGAILAVAGWRIMSNTSALRKAYVDDLVTSEAARSQGVGRFLLQYLIDSAREAGCHTIDLDSGVQRVEAHRFYLREGMHISSHHFRLAL